MSVMWQRRMGRGGTSKRKGRLVHWGNLPRGLGSCGMGGAGVHNEGGRMRQRGGRKLHAGWENVGNRRALHSLVCVSKGDRLGGPGRRAMKDGVRCRGERGSREGACRSARKEMDSESAKKACWGEGGGLGIIYKVVWPSCSLRQRRPLRRRWLVQPASPDAAEAAACAGCRGGVIEPINSVRGANRLGRFPAVPGDWVGARGRRLATAGTMQAAGNRRHWVRCAPQGCA